MTDDVSNETYIDLNADILNVRRTQCLEFINESKPLEGLHCEPVFDTWTCWPATLAGSVATNPCPHFIVGFDPSRKAHKVCTENGTWFRHPESGQIWSNYTTCVNLDDLSLRQQVNNIYQAGYFISLLALLLSLFILSYFKSLRCPRNTLHMNLFTSFAFNNFLWLLWYRLVIPNTDVIVKNRVWCQCLHVVLHYFLACSYAWMLAEGVYLHTLLVSAFTSEQKLVKILTACSWLVPFFFTALYTTLRLASGDTQQCWIDESDSKMVLFVLVATSMLLNFLFLCNIVRVVVTKLRAGPNQSARPSTALLQALRATLLLLPLLGLNYLLTPFRPPDKHPWETYYEVVSALTASFQGLCVATLFCFCNGEVIAQMKRKWQYSVFRTRANSYTATTVSKSVYLQFVRSTAAPAAEEEIV
ncbi:calcitonin gene-related peptide type 1 receptor-like isoform X2 [Cimex lectularius]|nr:calcitonin gene-related peptide type 1 receptor-like isoform X2 [Cimex lectularius]XP_014256670.1 calcitonin gene-related peptide type 1 receptor-like isoform X2 [Cimex lectularius]XP_024082367.1 calcitonin gene-related peptide type 1 receptor-like isoform X2 [Cimex lectularius]XP_024082368.1 calcitonin gene-related peptide type 1 receptor-like isoform X2 [Cimex lectularius]XP_024082369.1 calcitonin gene-related peptide type 1 receptor-like isoform X2 [Cimex lectularius]XP_024082370.1 calci